MQIEILTPEKSLYAGDAKHVQLPGIEGSLGVLENHAALITPLQAGTVKVDDENGSKTFDISGGVVEVSDNKVIVLAEQ